MPDATPLLRVESLVTRFKSVERGKWISAVDDVSITLAPGEMVGLVGESGCGKSTLGRTVVGLERASSGAIVFGGRDLLSLNGRALSDARREIQYIFQDPYSSLSPRQTIGEAIDEALVINGEKNRVARDKRVAELVQAVGLPAQIVDRYPREMSGGQRQRVCIARALAARPKVLICDEPVSSLDVSIRAQIMNLFLQLRDDMGMACLLIAHDLAVVRQASQRVYVMYLGRLMEIGDSADLYRDPAHPYTQALLSAIPETDPKRERERRRILLDGDVPSPVNPPSGCRFRTRCPAAREICATPPEMKVVGTDHVANCHFAGEVSLTAAH